MQRGPIWRQGSSSCAHVLARSSQCLHAIFSEQIWINFIANFRCNSWLEMTRFGQRRDGPNHSLGQHENSSVCIMLISSLSQNIICIAKWQPWKYSSRRWKTKLEISREYLVFSVFPEKRNLCLGRRWKKGSISFLVGPWFFSYISFQLGFGSSSSKSEFESWNTDKFSKHTAVTKSQDWHLYVINYKIMNIHKQIL